MDQLTIRLIRTLGAYSESHTLARPGIPAQSTQAPVAAPGQLPFGPERLEQGSERKATLQVHPAIAEIQVGKNTPDLGREVVDERDTTKSGFFQARAPFSLVQRVIKRLPVAVRRERFPIERPVVKEAAVQHIQKELAAAFQHPMDLAQGGAQVRNVFDPAVIGQ